MLASQGMNSELGGSTSLKFSSLVCILIVGMVLTEEYGYHLEAVLVQQELFQACA